MKRNLLFIAILFTFAVSAVANQVSADPDTILSVTDSRSVVITESSSGMTVKVNGKENNEQFESVYHQSYGDESVVKSHQTTFDISPTVRWVGNSLNGNSWECISGGLGIGFMNAAPASGPDLGSQMGKSFEIQWLYVVGVKYRFHRQASLTLGVGLDWRNYRTTLSDMAYRPLPGVGAMAVQPYPEDVIAKGSRVKIFSVMFPLLYQQTLPAKVPGGRLGVFIGPVVCLNTHGSVLTKWTARSGDTTEESSSNIGQRFFTVDLMAGIRFCGFANVYFKYSPQTVLKAPSPQFRAMSTGIVMTF